MKAVIAGGTGLPGRTVARAGPASEESLDGMIQDYLDDFMPPRWPAA